MPLSRRRVLASGSTAFLALAGCTFGQTQPSIFIRVSNETEITHSVAVIVGSGSTVYFDGITRIEPGGEHRFDEGIIAPDTDVEVPVHVLIDTGQSATVQTTLVPDRVIQIRLPPSGGIEITTDNPPESIAG